MKTKPIKKKLVYKTKKKITIDKNKKKKNLPKSTIRGMFSSQLNLNFGPLGTWGIVVLFLSFPSIFVVPFYFIFGR
jgi:hypothetical protein